MNKYVVTKRCSKRNEHNRILGMIFNEEKRLELEQKLMQVDDKCHNCTFHSSLIREECLPVLPFVLEEKSKQKWFNSKFVKYATIITIVSMVFVSFSIYLNIAEGLKEDKYFKYLAFGVAYFVALAAIDDEKSSKFAKSANTGVALVAMFAFLIELGLFK